MLLIHSLYQAKTLSNHRTTSTISCYPGANEARFTHQCIHLSKSKLTCSYLLSSLSSTRKNEKRLRKLSQAGICMIKKNTESSQIEGLRLTDTQLIQKKICRAFLVSLEDSYPNPTRYLIHPFSTNLGIPPNPSVAIYGS